MAAMPTCDGPDDDPALYMITNLMEAETLALCPSCSADFAQAMLQVLAPDRLAPPPGKPPRGRRSAPAAAAADPAPNGKGGGDGTPKTPRAAART